MTKLTNEELLIKFGRQMVAYSNAPLGSEEDKESDEKSELLRAEILKRMAEGAAGEASQGDLLAVLKAILEIAQTSERGKKASAVDRIEGLAEAALESISQEEKWVSLIGPAAEERCWERMCKSFHDEIADALGLSREPMAGFHPMVDAIKRLVAESGSASTAGPRPRCPKCGGLNVFIDWDKGTMGCNVCPFRSDAKEFFAAAPAEDCPNCAEWKKAAEWAAKQPEVPAIDWKTRYEALEKEVAGMEMEERMARIEEAAEDVQLDVEAEKEAAIAITKMVDMWLEKMNLPTSNKEGKQIFTQTVQDLIELALLRRVSAPEVVFEFSQSPCGHSSQYAYTEDGGKNIVCLVCERRVSGKGAQAMPEIRCPDCRDERISFSNPFVYCRNPKCEFMVRRDSPRVAEVFRPTTQGAPEGEK